jgi:DeoR family transcriptional regulator, fructose operon transcriptional repressor
MADSLYDEKRKLILEYIQEHGRATVAELSGLIQTSESTVRRNLSQLMEEKLVKRFHGGAILNKTVLPEPPVARRLQANRKEKEQIGREAASLVEDGDTVMLLSGTTVAAMVPFLIGKENIKVITHSMLIVQDLLRESSIEVIVPGGVLDHDELCTTGFFTSLCLKELRADKVFLGIKAIHPLRGMMIDNINEIETSRGFLSAAEEVIILCDHSKFDQVATAVLCGPTEVDVIITDSGTPPHHIHALRQQGIEVRVCAGEGDGSAPG